MSADQYRYPRRPLTAAQKKRLIDEMGNKCAICGATGVPLEFDYIIPLHLGGSPETSNIRLLCPNCHAFGAQSPLESEFVQYLGLLLSNHPQFELVQVEPILGKDTKWRPDLFVKRLVGNKPKSVLIECKSKSAFSPGDLRRTAEQVLIYRHALNPDVVVLAFPGRLLAQDAQLLAERGIEVWDIDYISRTFAAQIDKTKHPYFQRLFQAVLPSASPQPEKLLITQLQNCKPGRDQWPVYQKFVGKVIEQLFCPPLSMPISQSEDLSGVNRRDFIVPNYADSGFWRFVRETYSADYVVVDAKNSAEPAQKDDALQLANYLKPHGAGLFGLIVCRKGADEGCLHTLREHWVAYRKLIVVLDDHDIENMLLSRSAGGKPEDLVGEKIQGFRLSM